MSNQCGNRECPKCGGWTIDGSCARCFAESVKDTRIATLERELAAVTAERDALLAGRRAVDADRSRVADIISVAVTDPVLRDTLACAVLQESAPTKREHSDLAARFAAKVDSSSADGCWLFTGYIHPRKGYGQFWNGQRMESAHRVSYRLHFADPSHLSVLHKCDTRACVRPDHLVLGTAADNNADMWQKGRGKTQASTVKT